MPVAMMPAANSAKVNTPAIGRSASAACEDVWISVTPLACSVAAVAKMMNRAMRFEMPIPTAVSVRMRTSSGPASRGRDAQRLDVASMQLLHFLPGLPEEQVGADRRAEDGDQGHGMRRVKNELRD